MKAWEITRKDLKLLVRDGRTFVVLLALPVLFIWIIGMITGKMTGFNEPNRVLKVSMVDEIDYDALGFDDEGESLEEDEANQLKRHARNTFVKIFNGIQEKSGFEIKETIDETDVTNKQKAVAKALQQVDSDESNVALRVGPDFFKRVLRLSHRDIMDSGRGGLTFQFVPPKENQTDFSDNREGLEERLAPVLGAQAADLEIYREDVDLENAEITFRLPKQISMKLFDDDWENSKNSALFEELAKAAEPLELLDIYPNGLNSGLESLNMRLEGEARGSATHDLIEIVVLYSAFDNIKLFPLCANSQSRSQIGTSCNELDAEADEAPLVLMLPQKVQKSSSHVYQEVIPGYTVLFVFFLINIMARSFIHEKALGTLRRLRIAPVRPISVLAGKTMPFLFVSLIQTALLFLFGKFFFGMSWGPMPMLLMPVIICTSLAATSLGLLVATIVRSESQVSAYANLVVITFGLISGSMFPRDWLPEVMKSVSLVTPHAWALTAYEQILSAHDPNVGIVLQCCAALVGFAMLYFAIGTVRFGKVD
ncbi:MAG: ABC transporter permease [Planctomycetaceae bacterium]|jgi:ABC-type transport system involved in cytochrome c biogenesis permease component|nr:ABC transporter permease [Planctomycetaceae bacterium]MBT6486205.1 ABC transporter permease [Planctomycetaceae bacterium]MBT6495140.1 ABC transporter permease [Planctomycetaceae bacterium]